MKKGKKIVIGVAAVAVVAGGKRTDKKSIFCRRGFRLKGYKTCGI